MADLLLCPPHLAASRVPMEPPLAAPLIFISCPPRSGICLVDPGAYVTEAADRARRPPTDREREREREGEREDGGLALAGTRAPLRGAEGGGRIAHQWIAPRPSPPPRQALLAPSTHWADVQDCFYGGCQAGEGNLPIVYQCRLRPQAGTDHRSAESMRVLDDEEFFEQGLAWSKRSGGRGTPGGPEAPVHDSHGLRLLHVLLRLHGRHDGSEQAQRRTLARPLLRLGIFHGRLGRRHQADEERA